MIVLSMTTSPLEQELAETRKILRAEQKKNEGLDMLRSQGWYAQHTPGRKPSKPKTEKAA
jgi:hypothetical protein